MGWLRIHNQPDPPARVCAACYGSVLAKVVCQLHNLLHHRIAMFDADSICWFPTNSN